MSVHQTVPLDARQRSRMLNRQFSSTLCVLGVLALAAAGGESGEPHRAFALTAGANPNDRLFSSSVAEVRLEPRGCFGPWPVYSVSSRDKGFAAEPQASRRRERSGCVGS